MEPEPCDWCGEPSEHLILDDEEYLCDECFEKYSRDLEPPEPDGECFRGGESAAYEAEQQAWIQRNLK